MNFINENEVVTEFNELNISDKNPNSSKINHENCYNPPVKFWCKECVPRCIIEGWTCGNDDIDNFIKDSIYNASYCDDVIYPSFLEWVPFDRFEDMKQIGEGGFAKVYSATWIDGIAKYIKDDGNWIKKEPKSMKVALKRLNGSQNMSADFLNELKTHWKLNCLQRNSLKFYGISKDPETEEIMMVMQYADEGNLRNILSINFNNIVWKEKIGYLYWSAMDLKNLHKLGYFHKDFHSGNILNICSVGVLPYIAPEVLNGEPYTLSSDIYSFGVVMAELSSGKPPFHKIKESMMTTANELFKILTFWDVYSEKCGVVKAVFEEADKEIPNISTSYEKKPNAIYTSRAFTFSNLSKPINSSFIATTYLNEEDNEGCQDSQLINLEVPSTSKLEDGDSNN
ncbi:kinase-like domain-containing protein [Rhizophagus diaphanus]|nr:kinase-like domain-containing protein [Rhizophagus diaphanus] [Rhizophagus sp. MUCL 43196]